jgi:hypothetical protein
MHQQEDDFDAGRPAGMRTRLRSRQWHRRYGGAETGADNGVGMPVAKISLRCFGGARASNRHLAQNPALVKLGSMRYTKTHRQVAETLVQCP